MRKQTYRSNTPNQIYGSQVRDFTHVVDVARACELTIDNDLTSAHNVGTEEAYSYNEMVAMINDALGTDINLEYIGRPFDGHVHDTMADCSQFHDSTGWEPHISFKRGIEGVCAPYREAGAPGTN
ncbi:hypothetical protein EXE49_14165 [Halorubrum sp. ASP121]|nr:hypothetical protein EXE49_14165 [Halorubrum sp. ASP121]